MCPIIACIAIYATATIRRQQENYARYFFCQWTRKFLWSPLFFSFSLSKRWLATLHSLFSMHAYTLPTMAKKVQLVTCHCKKYDGHFTPELIKLHSSSKLRKVTLTTTLIGACQDIISVSRTFWNFEVYVPVTSGTRILNIFIHSAPTGKITVSWSRQILNTADEINMRHNLAQLDDYWLAFCLYS